jgi:hypothetical protein
MNGCEVGRDSEPRTHQILVSERLNDAKETILTNSPQRGQSCCTISDERHVDAGGGGL